jgi:protein-S-isoprenylcysteine O-methyltransferase Ste14
MADKDHPGVVAPPPAIFLGFMLLGGVAEYLWPTGIMPAGLLGYLIGGGLIIGGLGLAVWGLLAFRAHGTSPEPWKPSTAVVRGGPYRFSRNPMYLAMGVVHLGVGIAAGSLWVAATLVPALILLHYGVIVREERYLEAKFGETYLGYKKAVRRWL